MAKFADHMEKIAGGVTEGYKKIEDGVVTGYKKIEGGVVEGFTGITDQMSGVMLDEEGKVCHVCYAKPVVIGNDCWLGAGVLVMPGVTIGDNSVIGAGSVVTKDIPANVVAVGNPCKVLRELGKHDREFYWKDRKIDPKLLEK